MKCLILSIKPKWCEKIISGEKTIEVRKTAPKEVPFKAYIYETKGKKIECGFHFEDTGITLREKYVFGMHKARIIKHYRNEGRGKVIGEFICDKVMFLTPLGLRGFEMREEILKSICLTNDELNTYGGLKTLYGWHISDLKIYAKPKGLSEFYVHKKVIGGCQNCAYYRTPTLEFCQDCKSGKPPRKCLTRPPQSWCYVGGGQ